MNGVGAFEGKLIQGFTRKGCPTPMLLPSHPLGQLLDGLAAESTWIWLQEDMRGSCKTSKDDKGMTVSSK